MSRAPLFLIVVLILIVGAMIFLSSRAGDVPTRTVEVDVSGSGNGQ